MDTCETVLRFRNHRDGLVRRTVINLIPILAAYDPSDFTQYYLSRAMAHLLSQIQMDKERRPMNEMDRSLAFLAIGKLALVEKRDMMRYLNDVVRCIKDYLRAKG